MDGATEELLGDSNNFFERTKAIGNFTFKEFATKEELDDYIGHEKIGYDPDYEAVCFGFTIHENEDQNKYELELFFNGNLQFKEL